MFKIQKFGGQIKTQIAISDNQDNKWLSFFEYGTFSPFLDSRWALLATTGRGK